MVTLTSLSKSWFSFWMKCLYSGKLVLTLLEVLCSFSLILSGLEV